jgi:hypothetical protein
MDASLLRERLALATRHGKTISSYHTVARLYLKLTTGRFSVSTKFLATLITQQCQFLSTQVTRELG